MKIIKNEEAPIEIPRHCCSTCNRWFVWEDGCLWKERTATAHDMAGGIYRYCKNCAKKIKTNS